MSLGSPLTSLPAPLPLPLHVPLAAVLPEMPPCRPSPRGCHRQRQGWRRPVLARERPLLQWLCEGEQWCAHAESYRCCWPSALCPFPNLTLCPSQRLTIYASERRASSPAVISARMTQVADLCWRLEGVFSYILNICMNT